jgi:AraC-like DNA-binding protein
MKYVQSQRIERAKHLLRHDDANISTIAAALGFFDQSHFSRVFRKVTGISPGRYAQRGVQPRRDAG